ncbi:MAG: hypothetical protein J1E83_11395 [Lachnospiraceae bacterium]|nr:hypothetical protein [Lachnospiraceae bacterium]
MTDHENELHIKVNAFKSWAKSNYPEIIEENDNGEWCFCDEFYEMTSCALSVIQKCPATGAGKQTIDDLLYAIARDNECESIVEELLDHQDWFALLCRQCLKTHYTNAKWQFVKRLCDYTGNENIRELVYDFLAVEDEYTERMALKALADIYPEKAEAYALVFWNRTKYENDEYQKIMALHVLYQIHSQKLCDYLEMAEHSEYKYLRMNAQEIREKIKADKLCE